MPIEFHCHRCRKKLRVPDSSHGKSCVCPSCSQQLTIPFESDDDIPLVAVEEVKSGLDVPCPRCSRLLSCNASLLGTRGVCRGCGTIFEISESPKFDPALNENAFAFMCPSCDSLFEGKPFMEGRKGKCTSCAEVFTIRKYEPHPLAAKPNPVASKDTGKKTSAAVQDQRRPVEKPKSLTPAARPKQAAPVAGGDPFNALDSLLPPANSQFSGAGNAGSGNAASYPTQGPSYYAPEKPTRRRPSRGTGQGGGLKILLWVFGILFGSGMLLVVCGGIALFAFSAYASGTREIAVGDYSVTGRGVVPTNATPSAPSVRTASTIDLRTYSEFGLLIISPTNPNASLTLDSYLEDLRRSGAQIEQRDISRLGMSGIHYECTKSINRPAHRGEVFPIGNNTLLISMYINGHDHPIHGGKVKRYDKEKSLKIDDPDGFFASLRKR